MSQAKLPSYTQTTQSLQSASLSLTAADLHGLITGMLSTGMDFSQEQWKVLLHDYTNDGMSWPIDIQAMATELAEFTSNQLNENDFELSLLLDEEGDIFELAESVSQWVNHFISGIGLGHHLGLKLSNPQIKEAMEDLEEIARLGIDEDDDLNEQALLLEQVIEHVKVCVLSLAMEFEQAAKKQTKKTLH